MRPIYAFAAGIAATIAVIAAMSAQEISAEEEQASAEAAEEQSSEGSDRYSELVKVDGAFRETFVMPGVNFGDFNKVYFWEAQFEYRDVGPARKTRSTMLSTHKREFGISEEDRRKFEEIVGEAFEKEISKAKSVHHHRQHRRYRHQHADSARRADRHHLSGAARNGGAFGRLPLERGCCHLRHGVHRCQNRWRGSPGCGATGDGNAQRSWWRRCSGELCIRDG